MKAADLNGDGLDDLILSTIPLNLVSLMWYENLSGINELGNPQIIESATGSGIFNFLIEDMDVSQKLGEAPRRLFMI